MNDLYYLIFVSRAGQGVLRVDHLYNCHKYCCNTCSSHFVKDKCIMNSCHTKNKGVGDCLISNNCVIIECHDVACSDLASCFDALYACLGILFKN